MPRLTVPNKQKLDAMSCNRREVLVALGAVGSMAATSLNGGSLLAYPIDSNEKSEVDIVDSHVHVWTSDTSKYPLSKNFSEADMQPASFTPEELFKHTQANKVTRVVLIQMNFYEFDNSYMIDCIANFPGKFAGVGIVDHSKSGVVQEMRRLDKLGVKGFRLYSDRKSVEGWSSDSGMKSMWKEGSESGQAMCLLSNPDALEGIEKMCRQFPRANVVIDHFSRIGMAGPVEKKFLDKLCSLSKFENVHVKTSAFYALGNKAAPYTDLTPLIERLVSAFGASRLMWGSDCPYQVEGGHNYASSLELIRNLIPSLTEEDKSWLLGKTASKLFF